MKAAGSVMKAAGSVMKVRMYLSASYLAHEWSPTGAVANVSGGGSAQAQTDLDELFYMAEAGPLRRRNKTRNPWPDRLNPGL
jgi:hypothetical protein